MGLLSRLKEKFSKKENKVDDKYVSGMAKSRENFSAKLDKLSSKYKKVNQDYFDNLEEILIEADVGVNLSFKIIESVLDEAKKQKLENPKDINELLIDTMFESYQDSGEVVQNDIRFVDNGPTVLLVVGVNGVGKTTSIAKLANRYKNQGKKVMLCAADTFRAAAVEQLTIWANRLGIEIVNGEPNADPASVCYEAARRAKQENVDLLIVDTAGRLQNKTNLMDELAKMRRVLSKEIEGAPHETFLIIDGTTGQNGVIQAKQFNEVCNITGIVITKMDGTSKGGIILAIRDQLGIPVRFIGLGEKIDDLEEFDLDQYLYGLCVAL
ncbi:MAG: signal recognition particle-docking protein FtsY [Coprobacillus sp.]|nr:signal recognition particle-docking protein FtsY [Coprobacillus sp.]